MPFVIGFQESEEFQMQKKQKMTAALRKEQKLAKSAKYSNAAKTKEPAAHIEPAPHSAENLSAPAAPAVPAAAPVSATVPRSFGKRKSCTKAAGLKSAFVVGDTVYLTSYGKGNAANTEVKITADNRAASVLHEPQKAKLQIAAVSDAKVAFHGLFRPLDRLTTDNPTHNKITSEKAPRTDMLSLKSELEKHYFGRQFEDSLHIQIIHCILDLEKLLAVYVGNAVYTLNNLLGDDLPEQEDFIGYLSAKIDYQTFLNPNQTDEKMRSNLERSCGYFKKFLKCGRLGCFGSAFYQSENKLRDAQEIYHILCLIGQLRQNIFHGSNPILLSRIYDTNHIPQEFRDTMDKLYSEMLERVNQEFLQRNALSLVLLKTLMPQEDFHEIVRLYYDFIVVKSYRNIGLSIRQMREKMLDLADAESFRSPKYDSMRRKMYQLFDFSLFYYFRKHPMRAEQIVGRLRASLSDAEKEQVYQTEAAAMWEECAPLFEQIRMRMNDSDLHDAKTHKDICTQISLEGVTRTAQVSDFSKLIYILTFFLDSKEINELLSTLYNKFANIASFLNVANDIHMPCSFAPAFRLFEYSGKIAEELNIVRNLARMQKPQPSARKEMYRAAVEIFGLKQDTDEQEMNAMLNELFGVGGKSKKMTGADKCFRNFIVSNVICSSRFQYLVRYCDPKKVRAFANNGKVVRFVLKRLPDTQIDRYYQSCIGGAADAERDEKLQKLSALIRSLRFEDFEEIRQQDGKFTDEEKQRRQTVQAVISLYLTIMYLLMKNLVSVNARYVIGFHCMERDAYFYRIDCGREYRAITETLLHEANSRSLYLRKNRRLRECVQQDMQLAGSYLIRQFRNYVAHLSVVRKADRYIGEIHAVDSYFGLYHYIMQRCLCEGTTKPTPREQMYFDALMTYKTYVKDLTKAYCVPFGYNIPRFKNLSIKELFDRNETEHQPAENGRIQAV